MRNYSYEQLHYSEIPISSQTAGFAEMVQTTTVQTVPAVQTSVQKKAIQEETQTLRQSTASASPKPNAASKSAVSPGSKSSKGTTKSASKNQSGVKSKSKTGSKASSKAKSAKQTANGTKSRTANPTANGTQSKTAGQTKRSERKSSKNAAEENSSLEDLAMLAELDQSPTSNPASNPNSPSQANVPAPGGRCFWFQNFQEAREAQNVLKRPMLIHFGSPNCGPCRQMEKNVFSQESIQRLAGSYFILVKVDSTQNPELCQAFNVLSLPTDLILGADGSILAYHTGMQDSAAFTSFLNSAVSKGRLSALSAPIGPNWRHFANRSQNSELQTNETESHSPNASAFTPALALPALTPPSFEPGIEETKPVIPASAHQPQNSAWAAQTQQEERRNESPQIHSATENETLDLLSLDSPPKPETAKNPYAAALAEEDAVDLFSLETSQERTVPSLTEDQIGHSPLEQELSPNEAEILAAQNSPDSPNSPNSPNPPNASDSPNASGMANSFRPAAHHQVQEPQERAPILLDGFCPVSMVEKNIWTKGDPELATQFENGTYFFASKEEQEKFRSCPSFYALVSDGLDIVLLTDENQKKLGSRRWGIRYGNLNFVFATLETREKFRKNPDLYAKRALEIIAKAEENEIR